MNVHCSSVEQLYIGPDRFLAILFVLYFLKLQQDF